MLRNILVSVDRSLASQRCVSFAINHVYRHGDVIHLLHVIPLGTENVIPLGMDASELMEVGVGVTEPNKEKQKVIDEDAKKYLLENFVPHLEVSQQHEQDAIQKLVRGFFPQGIGSNQEAVLAHTIPCLKRAYIVVVLPSYVIWWHIAELISWLS
uniref:UspA domain-containing protein n=1 Tax=Dunaliella tertiolecta TaxID=3047 RepID=A0A7S3QZD3_DUNTE